MAHPVARCPPSDATWSLQAFVLRMARPPARPPACLPACEVGLIARQGQWGKFVALPKTHLALMSTSSCLLYASTLDSRCRRADASGRHGGEPQRRGAMAGRHAGRWVISVMEAVGHMSPGLARVQGLGVDRVCGESESRDHRAWSGLCSGQWARARDVGLGPLPRRVQGVAAFSVAASGRLVSKSRALERDSPHSLSIRTPIALPVSRPLGRSN